MKVSFDNVHFYEVKLKVDVDKLGGRGAGTSGTWAQALAQETIGAWRSL